MLYDIAPHNYLCYSTFCLKNKNYHLKKQILISASRKNQMQERYTARTVLFNEKNQILLLQFNVDNEIFWLTPGGKIELNETPFLAAQRELFEETGIDNADFITPHSYYFESTSTINGTLTLFKEHIFIAYNKQEILTDSYRSDEEKQIITMSKWWDLDEFRTSGEILYPRDLLTALHTAIQLKNMP
jgi:8-oxo-dGTP diphosphatase